MSICLVLSDAFFINIVKLYFFLCIFQNNHEENVLQVNIIFIALFFNTIVVKIVKYSALNDKCIF